MPLGIEIAGEGKEETEKARISEMRALKVAI